MDHIPADGQTFGSAMQGDTVWRGQAPTREQMAFVSGVAASSPPMGAGPGAPVGGAANCGGGSVAPAAGTGIAANGTVVGGGLGGLGSANPSVINLIIVGVIIIAVLILIGFLVYTAYKSYWGKTNPNIAYDGQSPGEFESKPSRQSRYARARPGDDAGRIAGGSNEEQSGESAQQDYEPPPAGLQSEGPTIPPEEAQRRGSMMQARVIMPPDAKASRAVPSIIQQYAQNQQSGMDEKGSAPASAAAQGSKPLDFDVSAPGASSGQDQVGERMVEKYHVRPASNFVPPSTSSITYSPGQPMNTRPRSSRTAQSASEIMNAMSNPK